MATILCVNNTLDQELRELGHDVISQSIRTTGIYSVVDLIAKCPKIPDYFIQKELLGVRVMFEDVHELDCRTAFWSIDTHLHYAWQMYYAKLFDVFLTPHKSFIERLAGQWQHPNCKRLAENGFERPFVEHKKREHKINFVGRLTGTRPQRLRISNLLSSKYQTNIIDNISKQQMIELYTNTCIVPNESIANEVNFRILEGASCGACVISPNIGEDQDVLFKQGCEVLVYESMEEFESLLNFCIKKPNFCEKIGHNAWKRVQNEHTPILRAKQLLTAIKGQEPQRTTNNAKDIFHFTTSIMQIFNNIDKNIFNNQAPYTFELQDLYLILQIFDLQSHSIHPEQLQNEVQDIFYKADKCILDATTDNAIRKTLCIACGGMALELQDLTRSLFYLRLHEKLCNTNPPAVALQTTVELAILWVKTLKREHKQTITGAEYKNGCYRTAIDFVTLCRNFDPFGTAWIHALSTLDHVIHSFPMQEKENLKKLLY